MLKCLCVVLLFGLTVSQGEEATTTVAVLSDVICNSCNCTGAVIDCKARDIKLPFEVEDWQGVQNLEPLTVDLSENPLTAVSQIWLLPIQTLNLSHCEISSIADGSFMYIADIVSLDLSHNKITTDKLNRRVFGFGGPPHQAFVPSNSSKPELPFSSIQYLSLANNDIHSLPQDLFTFMASLTTLDLSGNPLAFIDTVTMGAITDLVNLEELKLSGCELESLPSGLLRRQRRLRRLDLSDNRLTEVPSVLTETTNLRYLNFNKNPIQSLDTDNAIKNLTKLQVLHLCRNSKLQSISSGALAGLPDLVALRICHNPRLSYLDPDFLTYVDENDVEIWPVLSELRLNNNNLSAILSSYVHRWDKLVDIDVRGNPYSCDCKNQWTVDVLVPLLNSLGDPKLAEDMICLKPLEMRGVTFSQLQSLGKMLVCAESEGLVEQPVSDLAIVLGIMIGIFVTFPTVLLLVLLWRKGYFARCRRKIAVDDSDEETDAF